MRSAILAAFLAGASCAWAADSRCAAPPYGGSIENFRAFVKNFGQIVVPTKFLAAVCEAKFGGADRSGMYNLGLTDRDIDSKETSDLAVEMIVAMKSLGR